MTEQDMATFKDYANSEIVRLMKKRVAEGEEVQVNILRSVEPHKLHFMQGILQGLNLARNLMDPAFVMRPVSGIPVEEEIEKAKPMISSRERAELEAQKKKE